MNVLKSIIIKELEKNYLSYIKVALKQVCDNYMYSTFSTVEYEQIRIDLINHLKEYVLDIHSIYDYKDGFGNKIVIKLKSTFFINQIYNVTLDLGI